MIQLGICNEMFEGWDLAKVCKLVKEVGFEGIELAPFTLAPRINDLTSEQRREIRATINDAGLTTIGLHWLLAKTDEFYLTSPDPIVQIRTGDYLRALAEATRDLGGSSMVLGSPLQRNLLPGVSFEQAIGYASATLNRVTPVLESLDVDLCLEPLGPGETDFLNTCDQTVDWLRQLNHPRVKLHMDVKAQSTETGQTVPGLISTHAAQAGHFHAQDTNKLGPGMGNVEFGPILRSLVSSGYNRWVSVEVFDFTPGPETIAQTSYKTLKRELNMAYGLA